MEIGCRDEQQRRDGQPFLDQNEVQRPQDKDVGCHLGLVAAEQPLASDDILPEQRHAHDNHRRIQR
jgi:hypothetical protein